MTEPAAVPSTDAPAEALLRLRAKIDAIDDRLIAALKERSEVVKKVGVLKREEAPGRCPVRPGREATQLRRVVDACKDSGFDPAAAAIVWRMIIMASLQLEGEIRISVAAGEGNRDMPWIAREYFGPFTEYVRQPSPKRVIGDLLDGKASIGVLLPPHTQEPPQRRWWTDLLGTSEDDRPMIFACLPFVFERPPTPDTPRALAVARVQPEETGDDLSYLAIEADEMASQSRVQAAFTGAGLDVRWIDALAMVPGKRFHLVEVKGFVTPEHAAYKAVAAELGNALIRTTFLGAVAAPVILNPEA